MALPPGGLDWHELNAVAGFEECQGGRGGCREAIGNEMQKFDETFAPRGSKAGAAQINDVFVDERQVVYAVDRFTGGLYTLEMTLP